MAYQPNSALSRAYSTRMGAQQKLWPKVQRRERGLMTGAIAGLKMSGLPGTGGLRFPKSNRRPSFGRSQGFSPGNWGSAGRQGQVAGAMPSNSDLLLQQLLDILGGGGSQQVDESDLMAQISAAINPVFDARRATIESLMRQAEKRTAAGREDVEGMYQALSQDYLKQVPEAQAQASKAGKQTEELYGQLKSNIEGNYARIQQEQAEMMQQLGIEEAAPAVMEDQATQHSTFLDAGEAMRTADLQRNADIGNIDASYFRQGAPLANLEGSNRSADLLSQLQDYLAARSSEIGELEAARQGELTGSFQKMLGSSQQSAAEDERFRQEQLVKILMQERALGSKAPGEDPFADQSLMFLQQSGLNPRDQQDAYEGLQAIMQDKEIISGRQTDPYSNIPGARVKITPERIKQIARQHAKEERYSPQATNALLRLIDLTYG